MKFVQNPVLKSCHETGQNHYLGLYNAQTAEVLPRPGTKKTEAAISRITGPRFRVNFSQLTVPQKLSKEPIRILPIYVYRIRSIIIFDALLSVKINPTKVRQRYFNQPNSARHYDQIVALPKSNQPPSRSKIIT